MYQDPTWLLWVLTYLSWVQRFRVYSWVWVQRVRGTHWITSWVLCPSLYSTQLIVIRWGPVMYLSLPSFVRTYTSSSYSLPSLYFFNDLAKWYMVYVHFWSFTVHHSSPVTFYEFSQKWFLISGSRSGYNLEDMKLLRWGSVFLVK